MTRILYCLGVPVQQYRWKWQSKPTTWPRTALPQVLHLERKRTCRHNNICMNFLSTIVMYINRNIYVYK